jgi:hypothetical protein
VTKQANPAPQTHCKGAVDSRGEIKLSIDTARRGVLEAIKKYRVASDADSGDEENAAANELAAAADAHLVDESSRYVALAELVDEYQSEPDTET